MSAKPGEINAFVRTLLKKTPDRILIAVNHIEKERIWRGIDSQDVLKALSNGHVLKVRDDDGVIWQGFDESNRKIELICSLVDEDGTKVLKIKEAYSFRVGTAYDPKTSDDEILDQWLLENPEYELVDSKKKIVKRKVIV